MKKGSDTGGYSSSLLVEVSSPRWRYWGTRCELHSMSHKLWKTTAEPPTPEVEPIYPFKHPPIVNVTVKIDQLSHQLFGISYSETNFHSQIAYWLTACVFLELYYLPVRALVVLLKMGPKYSLFSGYLLIWYLGKGVFVHGVSGTWNVNLLMFTGVCNTTQYEIWQPR